MGATPSREARPTIRSLRYGNHEIGLIPITRAHFNEQNPQLRQQFIRVRNDPNVRYSHTRPRGYSMAELPPATYTEADLEALLDAVEASLFDTNEEMLSAGAAAVPPISMVHLQEVLEAAGEVDGYDAALERGTDGESLARSRASVSGGAAPFSLGAIGTPLLVSDVNGAFTETNNLASPVALREAPSWLRSTSLSVCASSVEDYINNSPHHTTSLASTMGGGAPGLLGIGGAAGVQLTPFSPSSLQLLLPSTAPDETSEKARAMPSAEDCATDWFLKLKGHIQSYQRRVDEACRACGADPRLDHGVPPCQPDFYKSEVYRRFKRAVRPVPCAVVFIYVNKREEHDCFTFQGHRVNVIGSFDLRSRDIEADDFMPMLQLRKTVLKAAGDRTLERVLALSTKYYMDSFTDIVLQQLQRRPVADLLAGLGDEARLLLREMPPRGLEERRLAFDPISIAKALFFDRVSKLPLVVEAPFNNYPALKFIYDFTSLTSSIENSQLVRPGDLRLCTYEREKGERGLLFLFHGRALALSWLWATTQSQPSTVRETWAQYTLCEHTQSRERRVQHWLTTDPRAKTLLGDTATTACFEQHLEHLHSEIVRARSTPIDDTKSWAEAQEYSHDMKLYRVFLSPLCGPLLTTVKTPKPEKGKGGGGGGKRSSATSTGPGMNNCSAVSLGSRNRTIANPSMLMQPREKKSPGTPMMTLGSAGLSAMSPCFSFNSSHHSATFGGSAGNTSPHGGSGLMGAGFLRQPPPPPPANTLIAPDGTTHVTVPAAFLAQTAYGGTQLNAMNGLVASMPAHFADLQSQSSAATQPHLTQPSHNAFHIISPPSQSMTTATAQQQKQQQPDCLSPLLMTSSPAGLSFSAPSAPWSMQTFVQPPTPNAHCTQHQQSPSQPQQPPQSQQQQQASLFEASPMQPSQSYMVQMSSNGVQAYLPVAFTTSQSSTTPNVSFPSAVPTPNNGSTCHAPSTTFATSARSQAAERSSPSGHNSPQAPVTATASASDYTQPTSFQVQSGDVTASKSGTLGTFAMSGTGEAGLQFIPPSCSAQAQPPIATTTSTTAAAPAYSGAPLRRASTGQAFPTSGCFGATTVSPSHQLL